MILYLCRHAEAGPVGGAIVRDAERLLSDQGERDATLMGQALARLDPSVKRIVVSPLRRAVQTAECIAQAFSPAPPVMPLESLVPGVRYKSLYEELVKEYHDESIVVVAHEPDLSRFISYLIADAEVNIAMVTASLARLTVRPNVTQPDVTLDWLLPANVVKALYPQQ
jgi:phosphohistidine phosphatase